MKTINKETWKASQSWNDERILQHGEHTLRTTIKRDAYDRQSHADIDRWSGGQWHNVASIHISLWPETTKQISYVDNSVAHKSFDSLVKALCKKATLILS